MIMYNVDFKLGQALVNAENEEAAKKYAKSEWGNMHGPYTITEATKKDYAWVKCAGGGVHEASDLIKEGEE